MTQETASQLLHILIVVRQRFIQDALAHILQKYPGPLRLLLASDSQQTHAALLQGVDAILADPILLLQIEDDCQKELRYYRSAAPLIALLPVDTRDYRDAALRLGANALTALDAAPFELLPLLQALLGRVRLMNGLADRFQNTAQTCAPVGEAGHSVRTGRQRREQVSDRALEKLAQAANPAAAAGGEATDLDGQVFLRGLTLSANAVDTAAVDERLRTACNLNCGAHFCGFDVSLRGGKLASIEPAPFPDQRYQRICLKGISFTQLNAHPERLLYPLKRSGPRGSGQWERIRWDQALDEIAARMQALMKESGPESVMFFPYCGTLSALNGYTGVYMRLAAALGTSANSISQFGIDSAAPSGIEATLGAGSGYLGNDFTDLPNSRLILIWGANPVQSRMNWWRFFLEARQKGARIITIDPRCSATAARSDEWLQVKPGSDLYLALGLLHCLVRDNAIDREFTARHTVAPYLVMEEASGTGVGYPDPPAGKWLRMEDGSGPVPYRVWDEDLGRPTLPDVARRPALRGRFLIHGQVCVPAYEKLAQMVEPYTPDFVSEKTGLAAERIVDLAHMLAQVRPARIFTLYGIDRWQHGETFGRLLATLGALTGNIGRPGAGVSVDGVCDSIVPLTSFSYPEGRRAREINPANLPGYIVDGNPYRVRAVFAAFNNWLNQWPDRNRMIAQVLPKLDLLVVAEQFMTDTARWADYVLPAATLFEREDLVKGPGPYIQYQPQILAPRGEVRSDFDIAASLAVRLGGPNSLAASAFSDTPRRFLEGMLPEIAPELTPEQQSAFFATGLAQIEARREPGVAFRSLEFRTRTGRIEFYQEERLAEGRALPVYEPPAEADLESETARRFPLVCITEHNFYRVHSSFNKARWLRELDGAPGVTLHPHEASARGIGEGDVVRVFNERGFVVLHARLSKAVPTGMAIFSQGWQAGDFIAGHAQSLTHWEVRQHPVFGANISFSDVLVEVARAEEA